MADSNLSPRDLATVLLVVFIWGFNFITIDWVVDEIPPMLFVALRFGLVAFPFVFFVPRPKTGWHKVVLIGLFIGILQFGSLFIAVSLGLEPGIASLVLQSQVVFSVILGFVIFGERLVMRQILGIAICALGFGIFFMVRAGSPIGFWALAIAIIGGFWWACGNMVFRTVGQANRFHLTIYAALVPPIPMLIASYVFESQEPFQLLMDMSVRGWLSAMFVAYFASIIGYSLWGGLLSKHPAAKIAPFSLLVPFIGVTAAALVVGEMLAPIEIIAMLIVIIGLAVISVDPKLLSRGFARNYRVK